MSLEEKLSYYVDPSWEGLEEEEYYENFGFKDNLLELKNEKINGEIVKVYWFGDLLEIIIHPDGTHSFSIVDIDWAVSELSEAFDFSYLISQWNSEQKIMKFQDSQLTHIDDKTLFEKIKQRVIKIVKGKITKDSYVQSHILSELKQLGYDIDVSQIFDLATDKDFYLENLEMMTNIQEVLEEQYGERNKKEIIDELRSNYFFSFLDDVFGSESNEYKEAMEEISEDIYFKFIMSLAKNKQIINMFIYCVMKYTEKYSKYISENTNINISLKQAYNALPENFKVQITADIFHGEGLSTKLLDDIIEVFCKKCKQKDGKQYTKREILLFLTDISMKQLKNIMPEDFDDSYDEPKSNPKKK